MLVTLKITSYQCQSLGDQAQCSFAQSGGTFGRASDNLWVLPDPERIISSHHGKVFFKDGLFYLTDVSTNGIFVSSTLTPIGKGNSITLNQGDKLRFGDYDLMVSLSEVPVAAPVIENVAENSGINVPDFDPLGGVAVPSESSQTSNPEFVDDWASASNHSSADSDPFIAPGIHHQEARAPQIPIEVKQAAASSFSSDEQIPDDWDITDYSIKSDQSNDSMAQAPANSSGFDPMALSSAPSSPAPIPARTPPPVINKPQVVARFEDPFDSQVENSLGPASFPEQPELDDPFITADVEEHDPFAGSNTAEVTAAQIANPAVLDPQPDEIKPPPVVPKVETPIPTLSPVEAAPAVNQPIAEKVAQVSPQSMPVADDQMFKLFLQGAGIDERHLEGMDRSQLMGDFGSLFREMLQGLIALQQARSQLKNEFRISLTTIAPIENNPLKFAPNVDEALRILFLNKGSGYLDSTAAIRESIAEIRSHQIAMISGMESAFSQLMDQLQPENFVADGANAGMLKAAMQSMTKKSDAWSNYANFYKNQVAESDNAFQVLFGEAFARAYEEQVKHISQALKSQRNS